MRNKKLFLKLFLPLCLMLLASSMVEAQAPEKTDLNTQWSLFTLDKFSRQETGTKSDLLLVLTLTPPGEMYAYANDYAGSSGGPTVVLARMADGMDIAAYYPQGKDKPDPFDLDALIPAYSGPVNVYLPLPAGTEPDQTLVADLDVTLCSGTRCMKVRKNIVFDLNDQAISNAQPASKQEWWPEFVEAHKAGPGRTVRATTPKFSQLATQADERDWHFTPRPVVPETEVSGLAKAIFLGLLAGFILNFMPCVLPVISIKLSAIMSATGQDNKHERNKKFRSHNLFFALGVSLYFIFLAALLGLTERAWGELFQEPGVVLGLTAIIFALGLSMFGVFHLPIIDLKFDRKTTRPGLQAMLTGVLATLLATPCSGPLLGGVLGWALVQPQVIIQTVFLAVGLGMASPYLAMAAFPSLSSKFPKPGAWTGILEKIVGFFLLATCIYLINILPDSMTISGLILLLSIGFSAWLWSMGGPAASSMKSLVLRIAAVVLIIMTLVWTLTPSRSLELWQEYDPATFRSHLGGELIVMDFTADWCPTCKFLESTVLTASNIANWAETYGASFIRVDLSEDFPEGEKLLHALGSRSIPLAAVFPAGPDALSPLVIRDLFTTSQMNDALKRASEK